MAFMDFNWWFGKQSFFAKIFGYGKKTTPTPPPVVVPPNPMRPIGILTGVANSEVKLQGVNEIGFTNSDGYFCWREVPKALGASHLFVQTTGYEPYSIHIDLSQGENATNHDLILDNRVKMHDTDIMLPPLQKLVTARKGLVRANGRHFVDDDGEFFPLGHTLFWALRGWKFDRDRFKQNAKFIAKFKFDYVRILGEVQWANNDIQPDWPDYVSNMIECIEWLYKECGLRTQITLIGGDRLPNGSLPNYDLLVDNVIAAVKDRLHMIYTIEVANEWYCRVGTKDTFTRLMKKLRAALPETLVAISDCGNPEVDNTNAFITAGANLAMFHLQRDQSKADWCWRHVRQTWDFKDMRFPKDHNEPGGPLSSVAAFNEGIHCAWSRLVGILNGVYGYCFHNGAGIFGQVDPVHNRPANVWEVANIEATMQLMRSLDKYLPYSIGDGAHTRKGLTSPMPVPVLEGDNNWPDNGAQYGMVRDYSVNLGNEFYQAVIGIRNYCDMTARRACTFDVIDIVTGNIVSTQSLDAGQKYRLTPASHDSRGFGAFLLKGVAR